MKQIFSIMDINRRWLCDKKRQFILILLVSLSLLLLAGCRTNVIEGKSNVVSKEQLTEEDDKGVESEKGITSIGNSNDEMLSNNEDENNYVDSEEESEIEIFGTWYLERVVLKSEAYDGTDIEALGGIDEEDYVGLELEYTDKYLRLGEDEYLNPKYTLDYMTVDEYNEGGKFKLPSTYGLIIDESIDIENSEEYIDLSYVPLKFYQADFQEDYIIPVGTQVVMLDNDTILVGIWGKILLANRIE